MASGLGSPGEKKKAQVEGVPDKRQTTPDSAGWRRPAEVGLLRDGHEEGGDQVEESECQSARIGLAVHVEDKVGKASRSYPLERRRAEGSHRQLRRSKSVPVDKQEAPCNETCFPSDRDNEKQK